MGQRWIEHLQPQHLIAAVFLGVFGGYERCAELLNLVSILLRARIGVPLPCLPSDVLVQGAQVGMPIGAGLRCEPPHFTVPHSDLSVTTFALV